MDRGPEHTNASGDGTPTPPGAVPAPPPTLVTPAAPIVPVTRRERTVHRGPRWPLYLTLGTVVLTLLAGYLALTELVDRRTGPTSIDVGEDFVRGICLAQSGDPRRPDDRRCGYGVAFELLSDEARATTDFADFCEDFAVYTDRCGPVVGREWVSRSRRSIRRDHEFRLFLGDSAKHQDDLVAFRLELSLVRRADGEWRVASYALTPDPEPSRR